MRRLDVKRKAAQRIAVIFEVGANILRKEGFSALTNWRIAKRLGISGSSLRCHFPTW